MNKNIIVMNKGFLKALIVAALMAILTINISLFVDISQIFADRKVQNIESFARLYGYARWFHPSDEAQEIDWNKFAILGVQKVENAKSSKALRDSLYRLFAPIVQGLQIYEEHEPEIFNPEILLSTDPDAKPVAWQHYGVYLNERSNIYKSIRTNKRGVDKKNEGTTVAKSLNYPSHLTGKEVKLSGYFKSNNEGAKLFVQLIDSSGLKKKNEAFIEKSQDWKSVQLSLTIPKEAIGISYGFEVNGDADVWADDFEFIVKTGEKWILADTANMGFERGKSEEVAMPVNAWSTSLMLHTVEITDENPYSGKYSLKVIYKDKMFEQMPQFGEITKATIGNKLICVVPLTLLSNEAATFPKSEIRSLKNEISNIRISSEFNPHVNLASVVIAWNVLQHFFPYFDVIDTDWDKVLGETLKTTLEDKQKKDFYVTLSKMIAKLNDGHGVVYWEQMFHLPIRTELIENEIVITTSNTDELKRGDVIKKIDGKPVMKVLKEMEKIISGSPHLRRHRALNVLGSKFDSDVKTDLTIVRDGKTQYLTVKNINARKSVSFNLIVEEEYLSETIIEIEPGIFYINNGNCSENEFEQNIEVLANAKAVIYDQRIGSKVRANNLNFFKIAPYLINEPVTSTWWNVPKTVYPDRKDVKFSKTNWDLQPKQPFFKSKTIIINVPSVVSAGETMMGIIDHYKLATTVGEPTAGCNGNINVINLPCGYNVMWTGMKVMKHDGSQLYLKGFEPDYPVNKTIKAIREGRDEYIEKAIEVARQFIINPK